MTLPVSSQGTQHDATVDPSRYEGSPDLFAGDQASNGQQSAHSTARQQQAPVTSVFPGYYARSGEGTRWHYAGKRSDTWRVWSTFFRLAMREPALFYRGIRQFYLELLHRMPWLGDGARRGLVQLAPLVAVLGPFIVIPVALIAAALPFVPKPKMFAPFTLLGLINYCVMLAIVSIFHTNLRLKHDVSPALSGQYANKLFWRRFFAKHLRRPASRTPTLYASVEAGKLQGTLPRAPFVVKPRSAGAGYKLCAFSWDAERGRYRPREDYVGSLAAELDAESLQRWLEQNYDSAVVESWEQPRKGFPVSSLRILTVRFDGPAELLSQALLVAPPSSLSTAHSEVHAYTLDTERARVAQPVCPDFPQADLVTGLPVVELDELVRECLAMHEVLPPGQVEVSWDILLTDEGAVYLEGNIIPPGCDYKLLIFENDDNLAYFMGRYRRALSATEA